ncbi:MAG: hypothetical protein DCF25_10140 [Leptolyngbya foveolarum]|uniref:Uncharacterized protein n=1 Tax=Leptolyngbya foveolarum TaxID=47253 RepID=A0A2W4UGG7_9CYAN|nr:MAG: hypothetical protein DCF25_10140 [Leptolyngbya foveolarum]
MNPEQNGSDQSKAMTAIDALLEGKSDAFKVAVLKLCRQIGWDDDDPGLLLAIATHQLEALVKQYPEQIETVMETASQRLAANWQQVQSKLIAQSLDSTKTAHGIDNRLHEVEGLLNKKITGVEQLLQRQQTELQQASKAEQETIRQEAGSQAEILTTVFQEQSQQLKAQAEKLAAHAIAHARTAAAEQVKEITKGVRHKHYIEAGAIACGCAAALMLTSWTTAWVSRGRADDNTRWADIERWNQKQLQACVDAGTPTCNFHIEMPKEKE